MVARDREILIFLVVFILKLHSGITYVFYTRDCHIYSCSSLNLIQSHAAWDWGIHNAYCHLFMKPYKMKVPHCALLSTTQIVCYIFPWNI